MIRYALIAVLLTGCGSDTRMHGKTVRHTKTVGTSAGQPYQQEVVEEIETDADTSTKIDLAPPPQISALAGLFSGGWGEAAALIATTVIGGAGGHVIRGRIEKRRKDKPA